MKSASRLAAPSEAQAAVERGGDALRRDVEVFGSRQQRRDCGVVRRIVDPLGRSVERLQ
jgi:hypothetical protein